MNLISSSCVLIQSIVTEKIKQQYHLSDFNSQGLKIERPPDEALGHFAVACFILAKQIKKSPHLIAQELVSLLQNIEKLSFRFSKIQAEGPYINFFFNPQFLASDLLPQVINNPEYGNNQQGMGQTIMLEYSSPNTNKPLHLGHCRNNLLGMTLAALFEKSGYHVIKANLINDRGIHICKSMLAYQKWGKGQVPTTVQQKGDKFVGDYYVLFDQKLKQDPSLLEEAQLMLQAWENNDATVRSLWEKMKNWVIEGFQITYQRMGILFDQYYFESQTYAGGKDLVLDALKKGICKKEENGAISIDLDDYQMEKKILLRGDGTSVYITQDLNTTLQKFHDYPLKACLFVVGNEQDHHFQVLFAILKKLGFSWAENCEHISYGMIMLPEGKMKSREGTVVDLDDLLDQMKNLAQEELQERQLNNNVDIDLPETAEAISQAAIKYYILKTGSNKTILFDPRESISFDGATGPYLQYTHARISTLLKKASQDLPNEIDKDYQWNDEEISLLIQIAYFPDTILESTTERNPAILANYIYNLSRCFNKFYYNYPILKAETVAETICRLALVKAVQNILQQSLSIMGIQALERM